jgi:hypothetical protein
MADTPDSANSILAYVLVFAITAVPGFIFGWYVAFLPCLVLGQGSYCNPHGGTGMLLGFVLGTAVALICGKRSVRWLKRRHELQIDREEE